MKFIHGGRKFEADKKYTNVFLASDPPTHPPTPPGGGGFLLRGFLLKQYLLKLVERGNSAANTHTHTHTHTNTQLKRDEQARQTEHCTGR